MFAITILAALQDDPTRVVLERGFLENIALVGQAVTSVLVLILLIAATLTLLALRRALDELTRLVRSTSSDITAAVHDAREVADELRRLTGRVRDAADVVRSGAQRVKRFVDRDRPAPATPAVASEEREEGRERPEVSKERSERRRRKRRRSGDRPRREDGGAESSSPPPAEPSAD